MIDEHEEGSNKTDKRQLKDMKSRNQETKGKETKCEGKTT